MFQHEPHIVVYNQGAQTLRTVPLDYQLRPVVVTSPSYTIEALFRGTGNSDREVVASTATAVDTTTATLDAAAGPSTADARRIQLGSGASSFKQGRRYLLTKADGQRELVTVERVDASANDIYTRNRIRRAFASGDTLRGIEIDATFPAGEANDEDNVKDGGPYRVRWTWTIDNRTDVIDEEIWIKRNSRSRFVSSEELLVRWPTADTWARGRISPEKALEAAHEDYYSWISLRRLDPHYFYTGEVGRLAVVTRALYYLHLWRGTDESSELAMEFKQEWKQMIGSLTTGEAAHHTVRVDKDEDDAPVGRAREYASKFVST